jgi:hypothetical protein
MSRIIDISPLFSSRMAVFPGDTAFERRELMRELTRDARVRSFVHVERPMTLFSFFSDPSKHAIIRSEKRDSHRSTVAAFLAQTSGSWRHPSRSFLEPARTFVPPDDRCCVFFQVLFSSRTDNKNEKQFST